MACSMHNIRVCDVEVVMEMGGPKGGHGMLSPPFPSNFIDILVAKLNLLQGITVG